MNFIILTQKKPSLSEMESDCDMLKSYSLWYMQQVYGTDLRLNWFSQVQMSSLFSALERENVKIKSSVLITWQMGSIVVQSMHSCITTLLYL